MKNTGIIRRVDELGRIVIPKEIRTKLEINIGDAMGIYVNGNSIVLEKEQDTCAFCNNTKKLTVFNNRLICENCISKISKLADK